MPKLASEAIPNELLMYERKKRHWTRDDVVKNILTIDANAGVDENTVGRWERGTTEPTAHHLRLLTQLYQGSIEE
jgi:transcriptional regulator with XRE-family HTH domain